MRELIIIGGGAAGLMCAVQAAECGLRPLVLERMDRVGKKLLATGNGRCNLMNLGQPAFAHGQSFADAVLQAVPAARQQSIWQQLGLYTRPDSENRVYPVTGQASSVLDALRLALEHSGAEIRTGCAVTAIEQTKRGWRVQTKDGAEETRCLVLAGGGKAQSKLGSDGSLLTQVQLLGLPVSPLRPGLCGLLTDKKPIAGLEGLRVHAGVSLTNLRGQVLYSECGEVIFAADGVSGVCVMNASSFWNGEGILHLDLLASDGMPSAQQLRSELTKRCCVWKDRPAEQLLNGILLPRIASAVTRAAGLHLHDRRMASLTEAELDRLCARMADFTLRVTGLRDFDRAQVTVGGVDTAAVSAQTMEAKAFPGLYILGEMLDVDGLCGGNNLMFAFATGVLCAGAIKEGAVK